MRGVLDASALLAYLHNEAGGERVEGRVSDFCISSVNWSEVVQKALAKDVDVTRMIQWLEGLDLTIEPFTQAQAEAAAHLWSQTRNLGLSLADRACLALALDRSLPVLTTDRAWRRLKLGLAIEVIR